MHRMPWEQAESGNIGLVKTKEIGPYLSLRQHFHGVASRGIYERREIQDCVNMK
jgi:hypothetical protein